MIKIAVYAHTQHMKRNTLNTQNPVIRRHWSTFFLLILALSVSVTACVPKKKLSAEISAKRAAEERAKRLDGDLDIANRKIAELESRLATLDKDFQDLALKSKGCEEESKTLKLDNANLTKRNAELVAEIDQLSKSSLSEKEKLDAALQKKSKELDAREKSIAELLPFSAAGHPEYLPVYSKDV